MSDQSMPYWVRFFRFFGYTLGLVRFSIIVLIAGIGLLMVPQGQDLLRAIGESGAWFWYLGSLVFWAVSIWFWARLLLDIRFPAPPIGTPNDPDYDQLNSFNFFRKHLPRLLGVSAFFFTAIAAWVGGARTLAIVTAALGGVFWIAVIYRRDALQMLIKTNVARINEHDYPPYDDLSSALRVGWRLAFAVFTLLVGLIYFVWGVIHPYSLGMAGAAVLLFVWGATFLPLGSLLTYYSNKKGYPLILIALLSATFFSLWNDNHEIRESSKFSEHDDKRLTVEEAVQKWRKTNCSSGQCKKPFVVVATAGGGIRAAFWTSVVFGELERRKTGAFNDLFAISGVSGGSVGAMVFHALAGDWNNLPEESECRAGKNDSAKIGTCAQKIIGKDTLGPLAASLLSADIAQRFWPFPHFTNERATAFETAWEKNFENLAGKNLLSETSFSTLSNANGPALLLNSTWSENGRRIVASTLKIEGQPGFERSNDLLLKIGKDLKLSTAMHNSARFPIVSPPGHWKDANGDIEGRLIDGGLFENYGAESLLELLDVASGVLKGTDAIPRVILISSDPSLGKDLAVSPDRDALKMAYESLSVVRTYLRTRTGRGAEAAARLQDFAQRKGEEPAFVHFYMCKDQEQEVSPPLGWALSGPAMAVMRGYLLDGDSPDVKQQPCVRDNKESMATVLNWFQ